MYLTLPPQLQVHGESQKDTVTAMQSLAQLFQVLGRSGPALCAPTTRLECVATAGGRVEEPVSFSVSVLHTSLFTPTHPQLPPLCHPQAMGRSADALKLLRRAKALREKV